MPSANKIRRGHKMAQPQILVVEDNLSVAEATEKAVTRMGYAVSGILSSGKEALKIANENRPELVLMDIVLEGDMDGVDIFSGSQ
jgi:DNA-binding response OmpR family regulator